MKRPAASLTVKITVLIVIVLIVGLGISTILTIQRESDLLVEQSKAAARRLTMTLIASIESAMLQERPDITRGLIQEMQSTTPVEGLTIYRHNGVEAFTDLETLKAVSNAEHSARPSESHGPTNVDAVIRRGFGTEAQQTPDGRDW